MLSDIPYTRAVGTVKLASQFLDAASVQDLDRSPPSLVTCFLLGHALELAFKAVLICHGISEKTLRRIGHDLEAAATAALKAVPSGTIDFDERGLASLALLGPYYHEKMLEYLVPGFMSLPEAREFHTITRRVTASVQRYVDNNVRSRLNRPSAVEH